MQKQWGFFVCLSILLGGTATAGSIQFAVVDHLGSSNLILDENRNLIQKTDYSPFGEILTPHLSSSPQPPPLAGSRQGRRRGEERGEGATPYLFTSQALDAESTLYYYGARFYDPALARFASRDPIPSKPAYAYVLNNPLHWIDPTGKEEVKLDGERFYIYEYEPRLVGTKKELYRYGFDFVYVNNPKITFFINADYEPGTGRLHLRPAVKEIRSLFRTQDQLDIAVGQAEGVILEKMRRSLDIHSIVINT